MDSLFSLFLLMAGTIFAIATIVTLVALHGAPEGHEDESGFHSDELAARLQAAAAAGAAQRDSHSAPHGGAISAA